MGAAFRMHQRIGRELLARKIIASTSPYAVSYARLSAGLMNSPEEVDQAVAAVRAATVA